MRIELIGRFGQLFPTPIHRPESANTFAPYSELGGYLSADYSVVSRPITQSDLIGSMKLGGSVVFNRSSYS